MGAMSRRLLAVAAALAVPLGLGTGCRGRFKLPADARFVQEVAVGEGFFCARMKDGSARCFGKGASGQLGAAADAGAAATETSLVAGIPDRVTEIVAAGAHGCAVTAAGGVYCWGSNANGEVSPGAASTRLPPTPAGAELHARHVALGARHTCALTEGGDVVCWGANDAGQLPGEGASSLHATIALGAGGDATCAVATDRTVRCWGRVPGLGSPPGSGVQPVTRIEGLGDVTSVALSGTHACAVKAWGGIACWGKNEEGELGDGSFTDRVQPVDVSGLVAPARQVAIGRAHTCALLGDGTVRCWGADWAAQLADGSNAHRPFPALVQGLFEVEGVAAAGDATCARFGEGSARCWGGVRLPKTAGEVITVPTEVRW